MSNRYQHNKAFQQALKQLNPTQRKAVDQIDGPVMVIAGPGTGKTQVLSARIGSILLNTDTQPYELLCLTYSNAGVIAMQQRLLSWIGPEAHRISIMTFHSLFRKVIRENPLAFGGADLQVVDDIERSAIIRNMLNNLSPENPLVTKTKNHFFYENHLGNLFQTIKQENWEVKQLLKDIDSYVTNLPSNPDFLYKTKKQKGQLKEANYYEEVNKMERLREGVLLFDQYNLALSEIGRYEFADMARWVVSVFRKNPYILRRYQEQFLYFLVDEYQDTNGVQNDLLLQLTSYWENPNVFVVGDDDQCVYEFQGARIKNITDFYKKFQESIQLFILEENYRSKSDILKASEQLIKHNKIRLIHEDEINASKKLSAAASGLISFDKPIEILALDNYVQELAAILEAIKIGQDKKIALDEMAIIYRNHKSANDIVKLLETNKIEYELKKQVNLLKDPFLLQVLTLLKYIDRERTKPLSGESLVFKLLSIPAFQIPASDIVRINYNRTNSGLDWWSVIHDKTLLDSLDLKGVEQIQNTANIIDQLMIAASALPLVEWIEMAINVSGILPFAMNQVDKQWSLDVLFSFRKFVKTQLLKDANLNLQELLSFIQGMQDNRHDIPVMKVRGRSKGIKLLTAHSSKGLEFRLVIMPSCTNQWERKTKFGSNFSIPPTISFTDKEYEIEEERRLFYVSITRAKEKLFILYPTTNEKNKLAKPSRFITELQLPIHEWQADPNIITDIESKVLSLHQVPLVEIEKEFVGKILEQLTLNISSLNSFLKCPVAFFYDYILKIPSETGSSALYGTAIHNSFRKMIEQMRMSPNKKYPSAETVANYFEIEMERNKGLFVQTEYKTRLLRGKETILDYYKKHHQDWIEDTLAEYHISNTEIDGIPVSGSIDRIDFVDGQTAHIVDFKTGEPKTVNAPKKGQPHGSDYWRQLVFYALLFEHQRADSRRVVSGAVSFVEKDKKGRLLDKNFEISSEDKKLLRELLKTTWVKIQNSEFYEGCDDAYCKWCTFQKTQKAPASFRDLDILSLDD